MKQFDIILVLGYFRSATAYLALIRHLPHSFKIGLIPADVHSKALSRNQRAQATFLSLCKQFGAEIVDQGVAVNTDLMVVQQFPYPAETVNLLNATIKTHRRVGLMTLAMAGVDKYDSFLRDFDIEKVYVPSRRFMEFHLAARGCSRYDEVAVVEVGLSFSKYPIFPEFQADYLIAAPTMFSFKTERGKHRFLRSVISLLKQIPKTERVVYKPHNGESRDYFTPRIHYALAELLSRVPGGHQLLAFGVRNTSGFFRQRLERVETGVFHLKVLARCVPLKEVTPYAEISLEAFLPGVRKGVIGGLSNTIWGSLYFGLLYYNCVDSSQRNQEQVELLKHKNPVNLLNLNLKYFEVPHCGGVLSGGAKGEQIVTDNDRQGDLLAEVYVDLKVAKATKRTES